MARASATRRAMPPESSAGMSRAAPRRPTACSFVEHEVAYQGLRQPGVRAQRECDVFVDVLVGEQRAVLEQHAHAPAQREQFLAGHWRHFFAKDPHAAAFGVRLPGDEPQQRGLAGARGTHERGDAATARGDVEPVENCAPADGVANIPDLNNGIAGLRRRSVRLRNLDFAQAATTARETLGRSLRFKLLTLKVHWFGRRRRITKGSGPGFPSD